MNELLLAGAYAGGMAGVILTLLAHVAPFFGAGNFIRDLDEPCVFRHMLSRREAHLLGVFVHLLVCTSAGILFAYAVGRSWLPDFQVIPMLAYALLLLSFLGIVVMPLEGHGFFGRKHDAWFVLDVFLTNFAWGGLYLVLIRLWA
jgi:hypothetical protein